MSTNAMVSRQSWLPLLGSILLVTANAAAAQTAEPTAGAAHAKAPLVLKAQGTFFVGGKIEHRSPNSSIPDKKFVDGDIAVDQMYVEYQVPENLKYRYPIIMLHGGGHSGDVYRTTPDGREGWFTSFARRGFAVYVVDAPNRGRSGWDPTNRFAVSAGVKPPKALESGNIYSAQSAWTAFRWGPTYGKQYAGQQFPVDHIKDYLPELVPSYRDAVQNTYIADDLNALIDKIGPCILLGWSTGAGNVMMAATQRLSQVKGVIAIEGVPPNPARSPVDLNQMAKIPLVVVLGDNTPVDAVKSYTDKIAKLGGAAATIALPEIGIKGNGHTMMMERNNEQIADVIEKWVGQNVPNVQSAAAIGPAK